MTRFLDENIEVEKNAIAENHLFLEIELLNKNPQPYFDKPPEMLVENKFDEWTWRIKHPSTGAVLYSADGYFPSPTLATEDLYKFMKYRRINGLSEYTKP